jgi:hypothetical protein
MRVKTVILSLLAICVGTVRASDLDATMEKHVQESPLIVVGKVIEGTDAPPDGPKVESTCTLLVWRCLKGELAIPSRIVTTYRYRLEKGHEAVYFLHPTGAGQWAIDHVWSADSVGSVIAALSRVDKTTRIPGMPTPPPNKAITVALAAELESRAFAKVRLHSFGQLRLVAQFENQTDRTLTVMPFLHGSDDHRRYPHYDVEITDENGRKPTPQIVPRCGNINPWRTRDFIPLNPKEVFRTAVPFRSIGRPGPGNYRVRLTYTAARDLSAKGLRGKDDAGVEQSMETVWEGTARSNWVEVKILEAAANAKELGLQLVYEDLAIPTKELAERQPRYARRMLGWIKSRAPALQIAAHDEAARRFGQALMREYPQLTTTSIWFLVDTAPAEAQRLLEGQLEELVAPENRRSYIQLWYRARTLFKVYVKADKGAAVGAMQKIVKGHPAEMPCLKVQLALRLFKLGDSSGLDEMVAQMCSPKLDKAYRTGISGALAGLLQFDQRGEFEQHALNVAAWYRQYRDKLVWRNVSGSFMFAGDHRGYRDSIARYQSKRGVSAPQR